MTIIVVDDERDIRELVSLVLESAGDAVNTAAHARAAREILATRQVALLITDYHMPEMTGAALMARLRASHPRLPIILASGARCLTALAASCGAHGWYAKGTSLAHMLALVRTLLPDRGQERGNASGDREA